MSPARHPRRCSYRLAGPALVCRPWHAACHMPDLISTVCYAHEFPPSDQSFQLVKSSLSSLAGWLARHSAAVRALYIAVRCIEPRDIVPAQGQALLAQLQRCEAACAAAGLCTFSVSCEANVCMHLHPQPPNEPGQPESLAEFLGTSLTSLRQLSVSGRIHGRVDLSMLTALQRLSLRQAAPSIYPANHASLPSCLTALDIGFAEWVTEWPYRGGQRFLSLAATVRGQCRVKGGSF